MELDRSGDMPTTSNSALAVGMGLNVPSEPLFLGEDNQRRSAIVSHKKDEVGDIIIPESVENHRYSVFIIINIIQHRKNKYSQDTTNAGK